MAWHGFVGCGCALSSLDHFGGHLPQTASYLPPSNFLYTYVEVTQTKLEGSDALVLCQFMPSQVLPDAVVVHFRDSATHSIRGST